MRSSSKRSKPKVALITGITGQDGSYLAEFLLAKNYIVHGLIRRASTFNTHRIDHLYQNPRLRLHHADLSDSGRLTNLFREIRPHEIYHLGAQSHVRVSFDLPDYTGTITGLGTVYLLESIRRSGINCKLYQASSSEMFGKSPPPQNETTPFQPRSPYAAAKLYAYWMVRNYREAYGLFACNGIMFNHESPRRGETFVFRKITRAVANICAGNQKKLYLGNLKARRDWGYAPEYVEGMWLMLQKKQPEDLVFGTAQAHTVQEFVEEAFGYAGLSWKKHVKIDKNYFRPLEVTHLLANPSRVLKQLGWKPTVSFRNLVRIMVDADMEQLGLVPPGKGLKVRSDHKRLSWLKQH